MKDLLKMKKVLYSLIVLFGLLGVSENAWGGHGGLHNFDGKAVVSSTGTGSGKVYVGGPGSTIEDVTEDQWQSESYTSSGLNCGNTDGQDYVNFFAKPADDSFLEGWYSNEACTDKQSSDLTYKFGTTSGTTTCYAKFMQKFSLYFAATAEVNNGGSVKIAFAEGDVDSGSNPAIEATEPGGITSTTVTAYFKAIPNSGYEFVGWRKSPVDDNYVSFDVNYSETYTVTSTSEASPTTLTLYAYFQKESDDEVQVVNNETGAVFYKGSFVTALANVNSGYTVTFLRDVDLANNSQTISKNISIDFNNRTISGTVSNLITISGATVNVMDNSIERSGGISVTKADASEIVALNVASGTLNLYGGTIRSKNTSSEEGAKAVGVAVTSGATLNLQGGTIQADAAVNAYGVKVPSGAIANLTTGRVNANAANNAYGVLANGNTTVSWSVEINATTDATNAIGVLVSDASANTTVKGGVITATAGTTNAYGIQVQNSTVEISGNMAASATAGTSSTAYAVKQEDPGIVNVQTGRFKSNNSQEMIGSPANNTKLKLYGGYYVHNTALATYKANDDVTLGDIKADSKFKNEGYNYVLSNGDNPNYVVASANGKYFSTLEDALIYANNNPETTMTIRLEVAEYTLSSGNYTLPAKATLLVPYKEGQVPQTVIERTFNKAFVTPSKFSKLVFESGVHLDVLGTIEVGCKQSAYGQSDAANGAPTGPYGWLALSENSQIVVADGGVIRAWGFITGAGTIDVRRGGIVREQFQLLDFKGGTNTKNMCGGLTPLSNGTANNEGDVFPLNQYFIQNVESRTTYHPGAILYCSTAWYMSMSLAADNIQLIGLRNKQSGESDDVAMFLMDDEADSEDTWVCKYYDNATDRQIYEINNSASLGSFSITMSGYLFPTANFDLPITNNMTIRLRSGKLDMTQDAVLLAGAQIQIDKQATFIVPSGIKLYVYDADQWDKFVFSGFYAQRVKYVPLRNGAPNARTEGGSKTVKPQDAAINVGGTMEIRGAVYTTSSGANVYSSISDAGTIRFVGSDAPDEKSNVCQWNTSASPKYVYQACPSVMLKNGDDTYEPTAGTLAGNSFCYIDMNNDGIGEWHNLVEEDCFVYEVKENETIYYAKPQAYVELASNEEDPTYHVYFSKDLSRKFICIGNCEWWEVEPVEENDHLAHCVHPDNNKYYYYYVDPDDESNNGWREKRFTVTWVTKPYEELAENQGRVVYNVDYKSTPKYLGTNPSREMTDYYTYDFVGWLPEIVPVTDDAVYVAQFQQNDRKYMITFLDEDGSILEEALWKMGEVPAPVNEPTPSGKKLVWEPTIQAVTGEATYRATYTDIVLPAYEVIFKNWNGDTLQIDNVATNTVPEYIGETPTKPSLADVAFEFEGWTPDLAPVDGPAVYTAKFREKLATYTIVFMDGTGEGDPVQIGDALTLSYGETPICSNPPTKASTAAEYYTVIWSPLIMAVTGDATYTATGFAAHKNTCRLTVSAGANGKVALNGSEEVLSAIYEYGDEATITATPTTEGYSFKRWSDGNTQNPRTVTVNAAISLTAEFAINQYEIIWKKDADTEIERTTVNYGVVPSHAAPSKATDLENTYTFAGWSPTPTAATANATYTATFNATPIKYTVRFVLNNGMSDLVYEYGYNATLPVITPVKASKNGVDYTFIHWRASSDNSTYAADKLPNVTGSEIYVAEYETHINDLKAGNSEDASAKDLSLTEPDMEANALIIENVGTVNIPSGASVTVQEFTLESDGNKSGQLLGTSSERLTIAEGQHANFDLTLNAHPRNWYAIAVPWLVNAESGIFDKETGVHLILGRDFDIIYYKGDVRAAQGPGYECWQYVEDDVDKTLIPGRLYQMYFAHDVNIVRFQSVDNDIFNFTPADVYHNGNYDGSDANWAGIANPQPYHARLAAGGAVYGYYLQNTSVDDYIAKNGNPYQLVAMSSYTAIVGKPFFIQTTNNDDIVPTATIAAAPRRMPQIENEESRGVEGIYEVSIGAENETQTDHMFVQTAASKEEKYVVGQDLLKLGVNENLLQMWVERYDQKLAVNTAASTNGIYTYPLSINIPQSGEYTIAVDGAEGATADIYLTKNKRVIWNLSDSEYVGAFDKGLDASYGLRVVINAPQVTTAIDEAVVDAKGETKKVLIDNQVYIIREGNVYSIDGKIVK